jgi:hypothetical protein
VSGCQQHYQSSADGIALNILSEVNDSFTLRKAGYQLLSPAACGGVALGSRMRKMQLQRRASGIHIRNRLRLQQRHFSVQDGALREFAGISTPAAGESVQYRQDGGDYCGAAVRVNFKNIFTRKAGRRLKEYHHAAIDQMIR